MLNININTYTIDFSTRPGLKVREFEHTEKEGIQLQLNLIWRFHVRADILKVRLVWSCVQYPCLTPFSNSFSSERDALLQSNQRASNLSFSSLSLRNVCNLWPQSRRGLGRVSTQHYHEEARPSVWVFTRNTSLWFPWGLTMGICCAQFKGALCECLLIKKKSFFAGEQSLFTLDVLF